MKVSVVTICYQDLAGLRATVESVRAQLGADIEHIIVDGGSGPDTVAFLTSLDPQPAYWQSEPDRGRYDAMNQGIARATGDIVWLMHAGDRFADPEAVASVVAAVPDPRNQWGYGKVRLIDDAGNDCGRLGEVPFDLEKFASGLSTIPHQGAFVGTDFARRIGVYDESFGLAADQLFLFRAALVQPPVTIARIVCDFDTTGAGTVRPIKENFTDLRRAWDIVGYYPRGSRWRARARSRVTEYAYRTVFAARRTVGRLRSGRHSR